MLDIIHGYSTIYPIPLVQACSFDSSPVAVLRQYYLPAYKAGCDAGSGMLITVFIGHDSRVTAHKTFTLAEQVKKHPP